MSYVESDSLLAVREILKGTDSMSEQLSIISDILSLASSGGGITFQ